MLSPKKSGSNSDWKKSSCIPTWKEPGEHSRWDNADTSYPEAAYSDPNYSDDDDSMRTPASTIALILKSRSSSTPTTPRHQGPSSWNGQLGSWQSVTEYDTHPHRLFRHWKFQPQQAGIWPTIKDLFFTLILSAGLVVVVNEVLIKLVEKFFLNDLYWFERIAFWTQWKMAVRWLIVVLWILKVVFDAGTVMGKLEIQRNPSLYPRSSFRSS